MTFEDLLGVYRQRLAANPDVKPSTKHYRGEAIIAVLKTWPELPKLDVRKISERMLKDWAVRFRAKYSSSRFNGTVDTLRAILNTAVEEGVLYRNPINAVDRASVRTSKPELPDSETFLRFVREIAKGLGRDSKKCADLVEFLAYGGFRIGEAKFVAWADCDMAKGKIVVRGHPETGTKNGEDREVPMIPDMKALLERLRSERPNQPPGAPVMEVKECLMAMRRAAAAIGMKRITHHDLRHLFATKCIESGVDIPTVSRWLGHKDGGALAMRVYGHLRDQHSVSMAQKVSFAKVDLKNVVQLPIQEAV
jgi:integrase